MSAPAARSVLAAVGVAAAGLAGCGSRGVEPSPRATPPPASPAQPAASAPELLTVAGVQFRAASDAVLRQCARVSRQKGFRVLCPSVVPDPVFPTPPGCKSGGRARDLVDAKCNSSRRRQFATWEYVGEQAQGHAVILAAPGSVSARDLAFSPGFRHKARLRRVRSRITVRGRRALLYRIGSSQGTALSGHTLLVWNERAMTYGVSFHGWGKHAQRLTEFLAARARPS